MARFTQNASSNNGGAALNYVQVAGTQQTISSAPNAIVDLDITTTGAPVQISVTGEGNNAAAGSWVRINLFRDNVAIGNEMQVEASSISENVPFAINFIDDVAAGTYNYSARVTEKSDGNWQFGEVAGPVMNAVELTGFKGDDGDAGASGADGEDAETVSETSFTVNGGSLGTQPTFTGAPLFSGTYVKTGPLVHFQIQVDMDNITNFGTGQYYVDLPFPAKYGYKFREGCLHDVSANKDYAIGGHVYAGESRLNLGSTDTQSGTVFDIAFDYNSPVTLSTADNFHISGTYIAE